MKYNYFEKLKSYAKKSAYFFYKSIEPKSTSEDSKRQEFILNILLVGSIGLSAIATVIILSNTIIFKSEYSGAPLLVQLAILLFFSILYFLSRKRFLKIASYLFVGIYFIAATYTIYNWGVDIPEALLSYALIIIMAGILINTRSSFAIVFIISSTLILLYHLQSSSIIIPNLYWRKEMVRTENIIMIIFILIAAAGISWLSNREIEKSLWRARNAEKDLQKERDLLEIKVVERTREIRELEAEKMLQMHRFAEFGKMAGGLFHDLVNPLTAALLSVDEFKRKYGAELKEKSLGLEKILRNVNRMRIFTEAARKQMQNQDSTGEFSPAEEISMALETLSYKARGAKVNLIFAPQKNISKIYGNQIKFYRLICDLISNAIDSYKPLPKSEDNRQVEIKLAQDNDNIIVSVKDHGCGIKKTDRDKIFQPLFTTKEASEGTGLGLFVSKNTVEKDFDGKIDMEGEEGKGATFTITIPIKREV